MNQKMNIINCSQDNLFPCSCCPPVCSCPCPPPIPPCPPSGPTGPIGCLLYTSEAGLEVVAGLDDVTDGLEETVPGLDEVPLGLEELTLGLDAEEGGEEVTVSSGLLDTGSREETTSEETAPSELVVPS